MEDCREGEGRRKRIFQTVNNMTNDEHNKTIPPEFHCEGLFCNLWNHWINPLGNWNEPRPYPEKRRIEAAESFLPDWLWWAIRNPFHNFNHYWIGIVPLGDRYEWLKPESNGWVREQVSSTVSFWKKKHRIPLPYYRVDGSWTFYVGWMSRGSFGMALRKNS